MRGIMERYFACWIDRDESVLAEVFAANAVYSESYGPEYIGIEQITRWFCEWNKRGKVLRWYIKRCIEQGNTIAVEWFFSYEYDGESDAFDGVTIAEFDENGKIYCLKEFQSKAEHCRPYGEEQE